MHFRGVFIAVLPGRCRHNHFISRTERWTVGIKMNWNDISWHHPDRVSCPCWQWCTVEVLMLFFDTTQGVDWIKNKYLHQKHNWPEPDFKQQQTQIITNIFHSFDFISVSSSCTCTTAHQRSLSTSTRLFLRQRHKGFIPHSLSLSFVNYLKSLEEENNSVRTFKRRRVTVIRNTQPSQFISQNFRSFGTLCCLKPHNITSF